MITITTAGEQFLAAVASGQKPITTTDDNGQPVVGDQIILAMVSGLDTSATPPKTETVPTASIVDTVPVNRAGLASESTAVFSGVIDSTRGDYSFNWIGLHNSEHDVLLAVAYEPAQAKYATAGVQIGNVLTKNFALTITSAAAVTGLTASIASWQFDYLQRFTSAEQLNQTTTAATFGGACFESPAGAISGYNVQTGRAIINGLLVTVPATNLTALQSEPAGNHPFYVYATVSQQATINGVANLCSIETSQTTMSSFDSNGTHHHRELIATITATNAITDNRASVHTALIPAPVKTAIDSTNTAAATATTAANAATAAAATVTAAANSASTAAASAISTANSASTDAASAVSTAASAVTTAELSAPPGAVMAFAMPAAPTGWLKCNGQEISRTNYADLFAAIGTTFGFGDGSTTFNVPDLRGEFIRGWDDSRGIDSGRAFGSAQADDFKSHKHGVPEGSSGPGSANTFASGDDYTDTVNGFSESQATGGTETRPRNIALNYCIRT